MKAELLINSGSRQSQINMAHVLEALHRHGFELTKINEIKRGTTLENVLRNIKRRKPALLIVGGGDGTISEAVDHLVNSDIEIGLIPLGTTNNFARSLNIPLEIDEAVRVIKQCGASRVDLGMVNNDYFTNVAGIGLSAQVARNVTNKSKRRWGRLAYAMVGLRQLIVHKPFMVTIEDKDHELQLNFETHQVIIANGRYHAGRQIAQDAKVDNRELLIFSLGGRSKLGLIWSTIDFYIGKRKKVTHASYLIGRDIELRTNRPMPVELDGEVKFKTPLKVKVVPGAVKIRHKA